MQSVLIEAAVDSLAAALAAEAEGAGRLELCAELDAGGLTPDASLQREVLARCRIPVFVMVRPRAGSFAYTAAEVERMLGDTAQARAAGAAGIVTGALAGESIDEPALDALMAAAGGLPVTFHRAFDRCADPAAALEVLIARGVHRVLTSGGAPTAAQGATAIARLVRQSAGRIGIVPGGNVTGENAARILTQTGAVELHARCEPDGLRIRGIVAALAWM
jgi:copper homeostasis protein